MIDESDRILDMGQNGMEDINLYGMNHIQLQKVKSIMNDKEWEQRVKQLEEELDNMNEELLIYRLKGGNDSSNGGGQIEDIMK